jgi:hypothetical protein
MQFQDDAACAKFIADHFDSAVLDLYLALPLPIMRADFWRVAVIYVHGGIYSDLDVICHVALDTIMSFDRSAVWMQELDNIANFWFAAEAGHPVLKLALDHMIAAAAHIGQVNAQDFGMHSLHQAVRDFYSVTGTDYQTTDSVQFLCNESLKAEQKLIHTGASGAEFAGHDYPSWRTAVHVMNAERQQTQDVLFFTTFNQNGYELYGREWVKTFTAVANYYHQFRARIYYEGFEPTITHPSIEWIAYEQVLPAHAKWKQSYLAQTTHADYVQTMTVRFSHKAFVIQHELDHSTSRYSIWLDGDCVFKPADYTNFPTDLLEGRAMACQVELNPDLNHVESGILIFDSAHPDTQLFNQHLKQNYQIKNILDMREPYDGFVVFKSLLTSGIAHVDLNAGTGGGIQSDPDMTFLHPKIHSKFVHNIGWTGKTQYTDWQQISQRDDIYKKMKLVLFGQSRNEVMQEQKQTARTKLSRLVQLKTTPHKTT